MKKQDSKNPSPRTREIETEDHLYSISEKCSSNVYCGCSQSEGESVHLFRISKNNEEWGKENKREKTKRIVFWIGLSIFALSFTGIAVIPLLPLPLPMQAGALFVLVFIVGVILISSVLMSSVNSLLPSSHEKIRVLLHDTNQQCITPDSYRFKELFDSDDEYKDVIFQLPHEDLVAFIDAAVNAQKAHRQVTKGKIYQVKLSCSNSLQGVVKEKILDNEDIISESCKAISTILELEKARKTQDDILTYLDYELEGVDK